MIRREIYRRVTRVERDRNASGPYDATFYECGHMDRFAPGLGPAVGDERRCGGCEHEANVKTVNPVTPSDPPPA